METVTPAILLKQRAKGENDKTVTLFTPDAGVVNAVMRGVKKNNAKLKGAATLFAFFEYTLVSKGGLFTVTGAAKLGDFSFIAADVGAYFAADFMAECTLAAVVEPDRTIFIELLRSLEALRHADALLCAIHYCQFLIHSLGYAYTYSRPQTIKLPVDLLYYTLDIDRLKDIEAETSLKRLTFKAIVKSFEEKFGALKSAAPLLSAGNDTLI